jgi:hypothetical protein
MMSLLASVTSLELTTSTREDGSGYIIRNDMGELIEAGCFKHPHIIDPHTSELLAWREGLEAAVRLGISEVILQTEAILSSYGTHFPGDEDFKYEFSGLQVSPFRLGCK